MKKLKQARNFRIKVLGIILLSFILGFSVMSCPTIKGKVAFASVAGLTIAFPEAMKSDEKEALQAVGDALNKEIEKLSKGYITETKFDEATKAILTKHLSEFKITPELVDNLNKQIEDQNGIITKQGTTIKGLLEGKTQKTGKEFTLKELSIKALTDDKVKESLKKMLSEKAGQQTIFEIMANGNVSLGKEVADNISKAVGNMTESSAADITNNVTGGLTLFELFNATDTAPIRLADTFIENFATVLSTSLAYYPYVDYVPKDGDSAMTPEEGTYSQLDLKVEVRGVAPVKATGYSIETEEIVNDIPKFLSVNQNIILKKVMLNRQDDMLFGDGSAGKAFGVTKVAKAYNPLTWTGDKVPQTNLLDVIRACALQIFTTVNWKDDIPYMPNACFVSPGDWADFISKKTDYGAYIFNNYGQAGVQLLDNITVVPHYKIPSGYILMGDFSKMNIINYVNYIAKVGYINQQMIDGHITLTGMTRFYEFVKYYDQRGFIYDTIANVVSGIQQINN